MIGKRQSATIEVWRGHRATLEPVVPEVRERLWRPVLEFDAAGPNGHATRPVISDMFAEVVARSRYVEAEGRVERTDNQIVPQGLIPEVVGWLEELGYAVDVSDHREDSPRWVLDQGRKWKTPKALHKVVATVGAEKALRVVGGSVELIADTIAALCRAYPEARIAVGVPTYKLLWRVWGRLRDRVGDEALGLYTARVKRPGRVSVGMIRQLPRGTKGDVDLLVLPFAEHTVGDDAIRVITSGQFRRVLSLTPTRWTGDGNLNRRLLVVAGSVFPPEKPKVPVTAIVLGTHGTRPAGTFADPLDQKKKLYWHNARRNRRVAEVAKRLMLGTRKSVRSVGIDDRDLLELVVLAAKTGVTVLVETPEHARELAGLLPGWAVWTHNDLELAVPEPGRGVIVTELATRDTVVGAGVLIRAAGTRWPLPDVEWPRAGTEHAVLVDFLDEYHPVALKNAAARAEGYRESGVTVWQANGM